MINNSYFMNRALAHQQFFHIKPLKIIFKDQSKIPSVYQCTICTEYFSQPVTLICGHTFCKKCIINWFGSNARKHCPQCRIIFNFDYTNLYVNRVINTLIDELEVICPHPGCEWQGQKAILLQHTHQCKFHEDRLPQWLAEYFLQWDLEKCRLLEDHQNNENNFSPGKQNVDKLDQQTQKIFQECKETVKRGDLPNKARIQFTLDPNRAMQQLKILKEEKKQKDLEFNNYCNSMSFMENQQGKRLEFLKNFNQKKAHQISQKIQRPQSVSHAQPINQSSQVNSGGQIRAQRFTQNQPNNRCQSARSQHKQQVQYEKQKSSSLPPKRETDIERTRKEQVQQAQPKSKQNQQKKPATKGKVQTKKKKKMITKYDFDSDDDDDEEQEEQKEDDDNQSDDDAENRSKKMFSKNKSKPAKPKQRKWNNYERK